MSATGRGPRQGGPEDYFTTPSWAVRRLLDAWRPGTQPGGFWLEPSAGNGAIVRAVNAVRSDVAWLTVEVREEARPDLEALTPLVHVGSFLRDDCWRAEAGAVSVVLGNPPYSLAEAFVDRARALFPRAEILYLLRLAFAASQERHGFMRANVPDVYLLPDRPSFTGDGSDSADYAWFRWPPGGRSAGQLRVLDLTPLAERQADRGHRVLIEPAQMSLLT